MWAKKKWRIGFHFVEIVASLNEVMEKLKPRIKPTVVGQENQLRLSTGVLVKFDENKCAAEPEAIKITAFKQYVI